MEKPPLPDATGRWEEHDRDWRDPAQVASGWREASHVDPALLRFRQRGAFWDVLDELGICLLVGREYEHLLIGLTVANGRPRVSFLPLPHPSGIAIDRTAGSERVFVASTRNPNQVYEFRPVTGALPRRDARVERPSEQPLVPVATTFYPGALYLHDLAFVGGRLHANAVGQNAVVRLDGGGSTRVWWPRCIETGDGPEFGLNHIQLNSIAAGRSLRESYFTASTDDLTRRRPGHRSFRVDRRGVVFSGRTREPVVRGLTRPHSARLDAAARLWVDDSGYGDVGVATDGRFEAVARLPGWTRGLALVGSVAFVGTSRVLRRFRSYAPGLDVDSSTCAVHAVDTATGEVIGSVTWPQGNQVFGVEWISRESTLGWPFLVGRPTPRRARELFYTFQTGRSEGG